MVHRALSQGPNKGGMQVKSMKKSATEILLPRTYKEIWQRGEEKKKCACCEK
jgi:hypothetical protein